MKHAVTAVVLAALALSSCKHTGGEKVAWTPSIRSAYPDTPEIVGDTSSDANGPLNFQADIRALDPSPPSLGYDLSTLEGTYPASRVIRIHDKRSLPFAAEAYLIQVSSEGYAGEGHATVSFARVNGSAITLDGAFGLFSDNAQGRYAPSFTLVRPTSTDTCLFEPCEAAQSPAADEIARYRQGWRGYFGPLPPALAKTILTDSALASFKLVDPDTYAVMLATARQRFGQRESLTSAYLKDRFLPDWQTLADIVCLNVYPVECPPVEVTPSFWPQAHFRKLIHADALASEGHAFADLMPYVKPAAIRALKLTDEDVVDGNAKPSTFTGQAFVCFKSDRYAPSRKHAAWSRYGHPLDVTSYEGRFSNGMPDGVGTVFFTRDCDEARNKPDDSRRLKATFDQGVPHGPAEYYNWIGKAAWAGTLANGIPEGRARYFDGFGAERSSGDYLQGQLQASGLTYFALDYYFTSQAPPFSRAVFVSEAKNGVLGGAWTDLPMVLGEDGQRYGLYKGELYLERDNGIYMIGVPRRDAAATAYMFSGPGEYHFSDGSWLTGNWNSDGSLIVGAARYFNAGTKKWYGVNVDGNGQFTYQVVKRVSNPWYQNIGPELNRWVKSTVAVIDSAGQGFEHFMCRLTGTKEGKNCNVGAGVQVGPGGPVLTDGSGTPSDVPGDSGSQIDWAAALQWQRESEMSDLDRAELEQGLSPFFSALDTGLLSRSPGGISESTPVELLLGAPTANGEARGCNAAGVDCGHFGASRTDVKDGVVIRRMHNGTDYLTKPGDSVLSPFDGIVTAVNTNPTQVIGNFIQITHADGRRAEITYVLPLQGPMPIKVGTRVARGSLLGRAADLRVAYPRQPNHIHVQYWSPGAGDVRGYWMSPDWRARVRAR